eukprot:comp17925_c1_seq1/m.18209 comp17925_c1_seq1/g.18209  ORF comp17925_c1_seq1/g.18209 comp17925_c1_seq1/m.18209 type:complete len:302 (-) comp17925_c1_seq1:578-1483(-)
MKDRMAELKSASGLTGYDVSATSCVDIIVDMTKQEEDPLEQFMKQVETTRGDIKRIQANIKLIGEKHQQALAAISEEQGQRDHAELDALMMEVTKLANRVRKVLKSMDTEINEIPESESGMAGTRIRKQQHAALSRKFVDTMKEYNDVQTKFKSKYRERVKRQFKIVKPEATEEEVEAVLDSEQGNTIFAQQILSQGHAEAKQALEDIQDRHKDIVKLEKSIKELHELFLDMAMMVNKQGEMIDRIEIQVAAGADYVEEAVVELQEAVKLQSLARKKQLTILAIVLIIVAVAITTVLKIFL